MKYLVISTGKDMSGIKIQICKNRNEVDEYISLIVKEGLQNIIIFEYNGNINLISAEIALKEKK